MRRVQAMVAAPPDLVSRDEGWVGFPQASLISWLRRASGYATLLELRGGSRRSFVAPREGLSPGTALPCTDCWGPRAGSNTRDLPGDSLLPPDGCHALSGGGTGSILVQVQMQPFFSGLRFLVQGLWSPRKEGLHSMWPPLP